MGNSVLRKKVENDLKAGDKIDVSSQRLAYQHLLTFKLSTMKHVTVINASYNDIEKLPPKLEKLVKLKRLTLTKNKLTSLPPELEALTSLHRLELGNNQLPAIPPSLFEKLVQLEEFR